MILDAHPAFDFNGTSGTAISSSTSDTASANVFDAGSAVRLFDGAEAIKLFWKIVLSAGTSPTVRARFVGADAAALTGNPIVLFDTAVISVKRDGSTALANTDTVWGGGYVCDMQWAAKRYYGFIFTLGGTTPSATCYGYVGGDLGSNMLQLRAATP